MSNPIAIYHTNCSDGTSAAAVFLRKFPEGKVFPLSHGATDADFAPVLASAKEASHVYFLDCEIGHARFLAEGHTVTVIDHHIGVHDTLAKAVETASGKLTYVFDNEKSGASLAWDYFFPDEEKPMFIRYIEDVDIWRLAYGDDALAVREYCSMYYNKPREVLTLIEGDIEDILTRGRMLLAYARQYMEYLHEQTHANILHIGPYQVPGFNVTVYQSGLGNRLAEEHGCAVALYTIEGATVRFSFRSIEGNVPNARTLAEHLGGGGHDHASGAGIPLSDFLAMLEGRSR